MVKPRITPNPQGYDDDDTEEEPASPVSEKRPVDLKGKNVNKKDQVSLAQMLKALDKDVAVDLEKKLKKLSKRKAIKAPLTKNKADQLERKAAYSNVTKEVSKWDPVVERRQKAKQLRFPVDQTPELLTTISDIQPINDLEKEIQEVVGQSTTALRDNKEFSKAEEKYLKAISAEEAEERHRELQRMRVLLSSFASKMRRQKQIKSKSYRRLLKHEKIRAHMKNVEKNEDALVDEIERLKKIRAQERATLKHKNTGKWAKHAKFRAKYDEQAREAMLEQIGIAKKALERPQEEDDDSDSDSDSEDVVSVSESEDGASLSESESAPSFPACKDVIPTTEPEVSGSDSDSGNDEEQRKLMSEAFADDDVVAEFQDARNRLVNEEQPKDVDLFLPGWGNWAGPGIKVSNRRRKKFIVKAKKLPRKDDKLGNVIISEHSENKMKDLMVKKLPFGVKGDLFSKFLRKPTAATFVAQSEHRKSIKPRIETKMGARIEPLSQKMLQGNKAKWA